MTYKYFNTGLPHSLVSSPFSLSFLLFFNHFTELLFSPLSDAHNIACSQHFKAFIYWSCDGRGFSASPVSAFYQFFGLFRTENHISSPPPLTSNWTASQIAAQSFPSGVKYQALICLGWPAVLFERRALLLPGTFPFCYVCYLLLLKRPFRCSLRK